MRILDLFCGAGGFSTGFLMAHHQVVYGIDNEKRVAHTYQANHPDTHFFLNDIHELNPADFTDVEIVIGSPPCPDFSVANARKDIEQGMALVNVFREWVEIIQPKWWIMENVPPIKSHLDGRYPKKVLLNAVNFGVAQFRERCFAGNFRVPLPTHSKIPMVALDGRKLQRWRMVKDAIGDLVQVPDQLFLTDQRGNIENCKAHTPIYDASERPSRTVTNIPPRQILANHFIGTKYIEESVLNEVMLQKHPPAKLDSPSTAIISNLKRGGVYGLVEIQWKDRIVYRRLSIRECARLQSFPDDFVFYDSITAQYVMIGNAVPPLLAYQLGKAL